MANMCGRAIILMRRITTCLVLVALAGIYAMPLAAAFSPNAMDCCTAGNVSAAGTRDESSFVASRKCLTARNGRDRRFDAQVRMGARNTQKVSAVNVGLFVLSTPIGIVRSFAQISVLVAAPLSEYVVSQIPVTPPPRITSPNSLNHFARNCERHVSARANSISFLQESKSLMRGRICIFILLALCGTSAAFATIFGSVRGIVHDPQHRPIHGATVTLKAKLSDWKQTTTTNDDGEFVFNAVPIGDYSVTVAANGFQNAAQDIAVSSGSAPVLHFPMDLATANQSVTVTAEPVTAAPDSVTPMAVVNRLDIQNTPGADRTNSLAMITDYVPGAYMTHDQLHVRGGHQVSWLVDGVPVPNTNIASNVGPQFDPKDVDYMEMQRGSYDAEYGDRTYGVFNVLPRTGFERNNQCELVTSFGTFLQTNDAVNCGSHTDRFAYYGSVNGKSQRFGAGNAGRTNYPRHGKWIRRIWHR